MRIISTLVVALSLFTSIAHSTVDGHDRVALVVIDIDADESDADAFFLERAPIIGCYGQPQGAALAQWTAEYKVPSNIGCGGEKFEDNINALTCAKVVDSQDSADYMSFSKITLDISKCSAKNNPNFITMIRTSAKVNFPQSDRKKEVQLTLIK